MPSLSRQLLTPGERRLRQAAALLEMGFECVPGPVTTGAEHDGDRWRITQALPAMATRVAITAVDASRTRAEEAIGRGWAALEGAIRDLSRHDAGAPLHVLNEQGRLDGAPDELLATLALSRHLYARSGGAFDVTVLPVLEQLRNGASPEELSHALALVGDAGIRARGRDLTLARAGMGVTLDGIAKGRVVDIIAAALESTGVRDYLVDAGGDIRTAGTSSPQAGGWTVAIRDPHARDARDRAPRRELLPQFVTMQRGAIATSGSYEIWFDDERTCHHVVSPRDGRSPQQVVSVTVLAPNAMLADGLATAAFLLGPDAGPGFVDTFAGCACLMVTRENTQLRSRAWSHAQSAIPQGEDRT